MGPSLAEDRYKKLKDKFSRERNKMSNPSGSEAEMGESTWKYFEYMRFFADHIKIRP